MFISSMPHARYAIGDLPPHTSDIGFFFEGTTGDDSQGGSTGDDGFDFSQGGNDSLSGFEGNDEFIMGGAFTSADTIDGGTGNDTLILHGDYHLNQQLLASTLTSVETIVLQKGFSYLFGLADANIAAGRSLTVDAHDLGKNSFMSISAAGETDGSLVIYGGHGSDSVIGTDAEDVFVGNAGNDSFKAKGGNDTFLGGAGDDDVGFIFAFDNQDFVDGGSGYDKLFLTVFGGTSLTLSPSAVQNIEEIDLRPGAGSGTATFSLTINDATVTAHKTLTVTGNDEGSNKFALVFDGSAELDGRFDITGADVNDVLTGGAQSDTFHLEAGGTDAVHGDGGNDTIFGGAAFAPSDLLDGGDGNDTLSLDGDYSGGMFLAGDTIANVENIVLAAGHNYAFTFADDNAAAGHTLTLDTTALSSGDTAIFNGLAETDAKFHLVGGAGADIFVGGARGDAIDGGAGNDNMSAFAGDDVMNGRGGADNLNGGLGADTITVGTGADAIFANDAKQSTGLHHDVIVGFDFSNDRGFAFNFQVTGVDAAVSSGELNAASFNADLAAAIGSGELKRFHAVLFTPDDGDLAGTVYLIVNANGAAGYQASKDYVFELADATHLNHLDPGDFFTD